MMEAEFAKVESYTADTSFNVKYGVLEVMNISDKTDKVMAPLRIFMTFKNVIDPQPTLTYLVNDELYQFLDDKWVKRPESEAKEYTRFYSNNMNILSTDIKDNGFGEKDMVMTKEGKNYILKINMIPNSGTDQEESKVKFTVECVIDSKTLLPVKLTKNSISEEGTENLSDGSSTTIVQYSNYNKVDEIILPKEAESAVVEPSK
ncbi:hypothetical protein D3C77_512820 [compost metagenome]